MILNARQEPQGLDRDDDPIADFYTAGHWRADAKQGSRRLRWAIERLQGTAPQRRTFRRCGNYNHRRSRQQIERVQRTVADYFKLSPETMLARRGQVEVVRPRQIAMYLAREVVKASYPDIGRCFDKDHTTVIYACQVIGRAREVADDVAALKVLLR